jgi:hypothetical protein
MVAAWQPLTEVPRHQPLSIRRIHELAEETPGLLAFLEEKGLTIGQQVRVSEVLPFNQSLTLCLADGREVSLGLSTARYIFAEPA